MRTIVAALAALLALSSLTPTLAQPAGAPTDCTEAMVGVSIFIGHDCGEWASVMIVGNIVIREPWSRANRASRAVRIRTNREAGRVTDPAPVIGRATEDRARTPRNRPAEPECHPAYGGCLPYFEGDALNCDDIGRQEVEVFDPDVDPYGLDVNRGRGNGITCDNIG